MRVYIAGPMGGVPEWNAPLFDRVAMWLRRSGYEPINPVTLDQQLGLPDEALELQPGDPVEPRVHAAFMRRDIPIVASCEAICMLPNWQQSLGANLELITALACGLDVMFVQQLGDTFIEVTPFESQPEWERVKYALAENRRMQ